MFSLTSKADDTPTGLTPKMLVPQFTEMTPEAASLGKYGNFNMSEYSGSPNIKIPLHTIASGNISFPMELYYDASGIKVEQDASFVGLSWNLSYGGHITHIVCGQDDFFEVPGIDYDKFNKLFNTVPDDVPVQYWRQFPVYYGCTYDKPRMYVHNGLIEYKDPQKDMENRLPTEISKGRFIPDIFQASFCGHNISFVIDKREPKVNGQYQVVVLNENPNKYKISYINGYPHPKSILITDDKGINYEFTGYREFEWVDSYYLTRVYGPDGVNGQNVITIDYTHQQFSATHSRPNMKNSLCDRKIMTYDCYLPRVKDYVFKNIEVKQTEWMEATPSEGCDKYYPSKITTPSEIIEFTLNTSREDLKGARSISDIVVKTKDGAKTLKKIHFKYGYYKEKDVRPNLYTGLRLRLDGVSINEQNYAMEYEEGELPSFGSYSKDYWGYYNGANNSALCASPKYVLNNNNEIVYAQDLLGNSNRMASAELCKVGMLKKIIYPTGGYTTFEFESNRFNDEFYYPDASFKMPTSQHDSWSFYGTMSKTKQFKYKNKVTFRIEASINSLGANDIVKITLKDSSGKKIDSLNIKGARTNISEKMSVTLAPDVEYTVEMQSKVAPENNVSSAGTVNFISENLAVTLSPSEGENGGYSIGGGLRIKSIKNYDAPKNGATGDFLNGKLYEYAGGKLLIPTVRVAEHYINYTGTEITRYDSYTRDASWETRPINVAFKNICAEPAYIAICSVGVPSTVGYDTVVTKELDRDETTVKRKKISKYHNYSYEINKGMNSRMSGNVYYYNSMGYLNGKIANEYIYSETNKLISSTSYDYNRKKLGSILFPKSIPSFFGIDGIGVSNGKFDVSMYRYFNIWCYLTSKKSTVYDSNGKNPKTTTASFTYNSSNYQTSEQTLTDGVNTSRTRYYYPIDSDNKSTGLSYLTNKHNISEVTAIDSYRNGKFVGGSRYNYTQNANIPVVDSCYSILPDSSKTAVLDMTVTAWDGYGNIREYKQKNGTPVTVLWSYGHRYPVMEIVGLTYSEVKNAASSAVTSLESQSISAGGTISNSVVSLHNTLKTQNAYVTGVIYDSRFNVSAVIRPNGYKNYYNYDSYGRLTSVVDPLSGILKKYSYNYKNK